MRLSARCVAAKRPYQVLGTQPIVVRHDGTNSSGSLLRMAWQPGPGNVWEIEDLTALAAEV